MWNYLMLGAVLAFAAAVQPGPFQTFLVSETLSRGWRRTVPAAFAPLLSDAPIVAVALLVLTRIPGEMIRILTGCGLQVVELKELYAPEGATSDFPFVTGDWASQWPVEEVWIAVKP